MEEEPVVKKEPVKVGKLNAGMFGGGAPEEEKPAPAKRSWKKKWTGNYRRKVTNDKKVIVQSI